MPTASSLDTMMNNFPGTASSPGSTLNDDDDHTVPPSSPPPHADVTLAPADTPSRPSANPRVSLQHVLESEQDHDEDEDIDDDDDEEDDVDGEADAPTPAGKEDADSNANTGISKRSAKDKEGSNRENSSIYSGNKVRHLKKDDGEPLWRKDIQYDFLKLIFEDESEVFTNSYAPDSPKQTFANLYIDTMARSSKTSKILRDKLLSEHEPAKNMAMVCLLVNLGRMNTTLNFFPEMRAQLRTYHAIPSLQAHQDPNSYKQLQDAPRLKSILKGASEDRPEPNSIDKIKAQPVPRTNPVNLIFVLAQFAPKVTQMHFPARRDFYDLIMRTHLSSKSRARAFLWLMWFYLESDYTEEGADENPFGSGVDYKTGVRNQGVPKFKYLTPAQEALENIDTQEELEYGQSKMRERRRIIEADQAAFQAEHGPPKRGPKPKLHLPPDDSSPAVGRSRREPEDGASPANLISRIRPRYDSDLDSTRSTPPPRGASSLRIQSVLSTAKGRLKNGVDSSPIVHADGSVRRTRPLTAHQLAVERNRNQRVDYILSRGIRKVHHRSRKQRKQEGAFFRSLQRIKKMANPFEDSEDEEGLHKDSGPFRERGFGGLVQLATEEDDYGEETSAYAAALRRTGRRLARWDEETDLSLGVVPTIRVPSKSAAARLAQEASQEREAELEASGSEQRVSRAREKTNGASNGGSRVASRAAIDKEVSMGDYEEEKNGSGAIRDDDTDDETIDMSAVLG